MNLPGRIQTRFDMPKAWTVFHTESTAVQDHQLDMVSYRGQCTSIAQVVLSNFIPAKYWANGNSINFTRSSPKWWDDSRLGTLKYIRAQQEKNDLQNVKHCKAMDVRNKYVETGPVLLGHSYGSFPIPFAQVTDHQHKHFHARFWYIQCTLALAKASQTSIGTRVSVMGS